MDFDGSGSYVPGLAAPNGRERIVLASAKAGSISVRNRRGAGELFPILLSGIFEGRTWSGICRQRDAIRMRSGRVRQSPQIGRQWKRNPRSKDVDGLLAAQRYLGEAFVTGDDSPFISEVMPAVTVAAGQPVLLWASGILDCGRTPPMSGA